MKIFHGSPFVVNKPLLSKGRVDNDYGRGFYCTEDVEMAREWACKGKEPPAKVNAYELDVTGLTVLNLASPPYDILSWIAVLISNRTLDLEEEFALEARDYLIAHFMPPVSEADVIVGYRADDSYFRYAESFVGNGLSVAGLARAMRLGMLGQQVALVSERAFSQLTFVGAEDAEWDTYHARYVRRDAAARNEWKASVRTVPFSSDDVFVMDIMRKGLTAGDPVLRKMLPV